MAKLQLFFTRPIFYRTYMGGWARRPWRCSLIYDADDFARADQLILAARPRPTEMTQIWSREVPPSANGGFWRPCWSRLGRLTNLVYPDEKFLMVENA
jgi:hypothetical protein